MKFSFLYHIYFCPNFKINFYNYMYKLWTIPVIKNFFCLVENLDCVKVDFSKQNFEQQTFSDTISSLTEEFLYDVSTIKPEVILADHIQESQYLMHTRGALRSLGYTGHFSSLQDGRGLGVFVRKDIADNLPIAPGTVYQSYLATS